ncbi:MAG: hypothetical protein LBK72_03425, partial [Bifidobacteriaceae bacterium]|nr:hypothetical protein [Bifidobacteriaceae bacterium]
MAKTRHTSWRRPAAAVALTGLLFGLTGCMRMTYDLTINSDDTITGEAVIAYSDALLEMAGTTF